MKIEVIQKIYDGTHSYKEGDKVKFIMKDDFAKHQSDREKEYTGIISLITKDGGFLHYDNISMPFSVCDIESISLVPKTLKDLWQNADGVYDFFNKNGENIDDMDYPLETEILEEHETSTGYWQIILNV